MPYTEAFIGVCARLDPNIKGKQSLMGPATELFSLIFRVSVGMSTGIVE